jgi:probable F420-dependent oxidoreductase
MELGVALPTATPFTSAENVVRIAQEAEQLGYHSLWTFERLLYPITGVAMSNDGSRQQLPESYISSYEPIETLSYVAGSTKRIKLGTSIINAPFQSPLLLARRLATLDQLSNGRVIAGIGQGWMEEEFTASNVTRKERGKRVEEYIAVLRAVWGPDPVSHDGSFYHIPESRINPKPAQKGGIPILIGISSLAAIKRAARLADMVNPVASTFEDLESAMRTFRTAAQEAGRDPAVLKVVVRANSPVTARPVAEEKRTFLSGSAEQVAHDLSRAQDLGVDEVFFQNMSRSSIEEAVERMEELQAVVNR